MSILGIVGEAIGKVTGLIDDLHTSDEEKLAAKASILAVQTDLTKAVLDYEAKLASEQGQTVRAEVTGHSWMQRNWRPIVMLLFAYIIAHNYVLVPVLGLSGVDIPSDMWQLLKIGLGGYVIGRSAEKIVPATVGAMKAREEA